MLRDGEEGYRLLKNGRRKIKVLCRSIFQDRHLQFQTTIIRSDELEPLNFSLDLEK